MIQVMLQVDDRKITNSVNWGAQTMTFRDVINKSLKHWCCFCTENSWWWGINEKARTTWYDYLDKSLFIW